VVVVALDLDDFAVLYEQLHTAPAMAAGTGRPSRRFKSCVVFVRQPQLPFADTLDFTHILIITLFYQKSSSL
jgi:hypothetical protein